MIVSKAHIESLIPQRRPFVMIDNLLQADASKFETDFLITKENLFLDGSEFREFGLIENMAQSTAAGLAYVKRDDQNRPGDGFLGGIRKLLLHGLPCVGDRLVTVIKPKAAFANMYLVEGAVYVKGKLIVTCELKLAGTGHVIAKEISI